MRLIAGEREGIYDVVEVDPDGGRFRTVFQPTGHVVFVYGREVKDFRSLDYDAIAMLNVSATQQIKKEKDAEVGALQQENRALRARLEILETRDKLRDERLSKLEHALDALAAARAPQPPGRTVSLK